MRRKATRKSGNLKRPKTKLGLPDLDHSKSAVLNSLRSPESKRGYRHSIDEFIQWHCSEARLWSDPFSASISQFVTTLVID
jgi:hypothetical protein